MEQAPFGLDWHLVNLGRRLAAKFKRLRRLVALARELASKQRMTTIIEPRLVSACLLPTLDEQIAAVADVLVDLSPEVTDDTDTEKE